MQFSLPGLLHRDWIGAEVPSTVLAAQVAAGIFPDPYFGDNLAQNSRCLLPIGELFANHSHARRIARIAVAGGIRDAFHGAGPPPTGPPPLAPLRRHQLSRRRFGSTPQIADPRKSRALTAPMTSM